MTNNDYVNRRKYPRVVYPCLVIVKDEKGQQTAVLCHTENVGAGGLSLTVKEKINPDAIVDIELDLLDLHDNVKCQGSIAWIIKRKKDSKIKPLYYDVGIEFQDLSKKDRDRINVMVKQVAQKEDIK